MNNLGNIIKQHRKEKGLSQLDLSLLANWENPSTLSRIESGEVKPTRETIIKLSEALSLNKDQLNILLRTAQYIEFEPEITKEYVNELIQSIKDEWNKNKFPMLLIDVPMNLLYWNEANEKFFIIAINDKKHVDKYKGKSYIELLFNEEYDLKKNIINKEEFYKIIVKNVYAWHLYQGSDRGFGEALENCMQIEEFKKYWDIVKLEVQPFEMNYNIPFIYNHPIIGLISLYFTTFILRDDHRFFVEQLTPQTPQDNLKLEEYLNR